MKNYLLIEKKLSISQFARCITSDAFNVNVYRKSVCYGIQGY